MDQDTLDVLIVDDHPVFRHGLASILTTHPSVGAVHEAATGREAIELAEALQPDVVVMDLGLPDVSGVDATRSIVATSPHIAVLILTMDQNDGSIFTAVRAGARGYLLKDAGLIEIVRAIQAVGGGDAVFGQSIAMRVTEYLSGGPSIDAPLFPELTSREREVLDLIAQGKNNTQIAKHLYLSPKTVRNHVSNIFSKLQVADRSEAIVRARNAGLGIDPRTSPP
jgi:DNA-binding NarL/FixJ family response regulator